MSRHSRSRSNRQYASGPSRAPRTDRLNRLLAEIIAEEIEKYDDPGLELATVTGVEVDREIAHAKVYLSHLDDEMMAALMARRRELQSSINAQTHMRSTPVLSFHADPAVAAGSKVDEILADLKQKGEL